MKTITIIITTVLALTFTSLSASTPAPTNPVTKSTVLSVLAPIIPMEASFEDAEFTTDYSSLLPETPAEATFEEATAIVDYAKLAPVVPTTADFE